MKKKTSILILLGALAGAATTAAAQAPKREIEAEQLFREGRRLMDAGDYAAACDAFEGSLRKDPAVSTRLNLGNCREKNQQYASAWGHFVEAARQARNNAGQADLLKVAEERAAQLEGRLSYLIINVPDEARVDGLTISRDGEPVDPATWNRDIPVDGGLYVVEGKAPAYEPWATTVKVGVAKDKQSVNVPRFATVAPSGSASGAEAPASKGAAGKDAAGAAPAGPRTGEGRTAVTRDATAGRPSRFTTRRKVAVGAWAVGAASLGTSLAFELSARSTYDDALAASDSATRRSLTDDANHQRTVATIAGGLGLAAVITGAYLWFSGAPATPGHADLALVPSLTPDAATASIIGAF